ncbi:unnamed protein product [Sphagnum balticum]
MEEEKEEEEEEEKKEMEMEEEEEKKKKLEMEEEEELLSSTFEEVSRRPGYLASTTASTQRQMPALAYTKKEKQSTKPISAEEIANTEVSTEISSDGGGPGATTTTTATTVTPESDKNIIGTVTSDDDDDDDDDASMESSENQSDIMGLDPDSMMASRKFSVQQQENHLQILLPAAVAAAENAYSYSRTSTPGLNGNNVLLQQADDAAAAAGQQIHRKSTYNYGSMSMLSPTAMYRQSMQQLREITQQRERSFLQEKSMYNTRGYHPYKCSSSPSSVCCSYVTVAGIGFLVICALLGLIALLIYVILRPQLPKVGISNVQIRQFNAAGGVVSGGNNAVLNLDMNFVVQCVNPNPRLGIDYLQLSILASFQNTSFPVTKVDPFFQVKRSAKLEVANLQATNFAMASLDDGSALQTAIALNNIPLHAHIDVKAAVQAGSWQTPSFNINFACDLMVSPPSSPSTAGQLLGVVCLRTKDKIPLSLLNPVS